ncbi:MAG: DUF2163 domain-containing protein [Pseudomonadota bacterium]
MSWNPSDKNAAITLSETGNVLATATNTAWKSVRGENGKSTGKWYFEVKILYAGVYQLVGVGTASASLSTFVGNDTHGWGYYAINGKKVYDTNTEVTYGATFTADDIVGVLVDFDDGSLTFYKNNVSQGVAFTGLSGPLFPMYSPYTLNNAGRIYSTAAALNYSPPAGATAWDDTPATSHTITASAGANGSIDPTGEVEVDTGEDQPFAIAADEGYHVDDVLVDDVSVGAVESYTFEDVTDDHTIEASFAANASHTISAIASPHGTISPAGDTVVAYGGSQLYSISPDEGYMVGGLLVDLIDQGALLESYLFEDVTEDHTISPAFVRDLRIMDHLALPVTTVCELWKIVRADDTVLCFTTFNRDLVYRGLTYYAARGGFLSTAISMSSDFSTGNLELNGFMDSSAITRADLLAKLYDGAELTIGVVNYMDLTISQLVLCVGTLGEVKCEEGKFTVEMLDFGKRLQQVVGDTIEKYCLARFCDSRCGLDAGDWTTTGTVTSVHPDDTRRRFWDNAFTDADNFYQYGELTWLTGDNAGYVVEIVESNDEGFFALFETMPQAIQAGDTFSVIAGCDKEAVTCKTKWGDSNIVNFRGFGLFLPGRSGLLDYPDRT